VIRRDQECSNKIAQMRWLVDEAPASGVSDQTMDDIRAMALKQVGLGG
jgi:antitoxin ParD1/3/4